MAVRNFVLGTLFCAVSLTACMGIGDEDVDMPTGTTSPPPDLTPMAESGRIGGFVYDESHNCIIGARVEITDGLRAGWATSQGSCSPWDYGDDVGFLFFDLPIALPVTLRASAEGYTPVVVQGATTSWRIPYPLTDIVLKKAK
jgi:hypothetical protein